jgi:hypothetical protein
MGSSDPVPAGFEIRFESLNFQAMGNDYLMRITNRAELHPWWSTGPGPVPATPATNAPAPAQADAAGPRHHDADDAPASALIRRRWNDVGLHVSSHNATHPLTRRQQHPRGSALFLSRSSPTECATLRRCTPRPRAPMWGRTRTSPTITS